MVPTQDYEIVQAMHKYGGSFVKIIAQACEQADHLNYVKLKNAFPEYWKQYENMAKKLPL